MTLRCRPGDLAIITSAIPELAHTVGLIVEVLKRAPVQAEPFRLPCGSWAISEPDAWVVRFPREVAWEYTDGSKCTALFACVEDCRLRPIRDPGPDAVDEMLLDLEVAA